MEKRLSFLLIILFFAVSTFTAKGDLLHDKLIEKGYDIVNIENKSLSNFLNDSSYDTPGLTSDYKFSVVSKYSKGATSKPAGIMLRWDSISPVEEISLIELCLIESDVEKDESIFDEDLSRKTVKYYYPDINNLEYLLCNMRPHKYYYYTLEQEQTDGQRIMLKKGKFYTEGRVRMMRVGGMYNVRDFGGWKSTLGKTVTYGRIFRGNRPDDITETGKNDFVKNEHITADLDLRGLNLKESPMGPLEDVDYYCTNNSRYTSALTGNTKVLVQNLDTIAHVLRNGGNVFLHCNHGANRAGTLSFVIEGILGLNEADLSRDYEISSMCYGTVIRTKNYGSMLPEIRAYGMPDDDMAQCFYNFAYCIGVSEDTLDTIRCIMLGLSPNDPIIIKAHQN